MFTAEAVFLNGVYAVFQDSPVVPAVAYHGKQEGGAFAPVFRQLDGAGGAGDLPGQDAVRLAYEGQLRAEGGGLTEQMEIVVPERRPAKQVLHRRLRSLTFPRLPSSRSLQMCIRDRWWSRSEQAL